MASTTGHTAAVRRLACPTCSSEVFFDSLSCVVCRTALIMIVEPGGSIATASMVDRLPCANRTRWRCNWLGLDTGICESCTILDAADHHDDRRMIVFQSAQRRALYQLDVVGLAWRRVSTDEFGLAAPGELQFTYRSSAAGDQAVIGHTGGVINLDLDEADPAVREQIRTNLGEYYRTPLGHIRHELGHFAWMRLVAPDATRLDSFRSAFGDERADYQESLADHYRRRDDGTWTGEFVSYYASAHPWEDFAESFAQVLHVYDVVETAAAWGLVGPPPDPADGAAWIGVSIEASVAANELARAMGTNDLYPFALTRHAWDKVRWCWRLLAETSSERRAPSS